MIIMMLIIYQIQSIELFHGLDAEFFSFKSLKKTYENAVSAEDKEHVTSYIKRTNLFKKKTILIMMIIHILD